MPLNERAAYEKLPMHACHHNCTFHFLLAEDRHFMSTVGVIITIKLKWPNRHHQSQHLWDQICHLGYLA